MTLHTDKDLKSKNLRGKKVYILAKDIDSILKSKPTKICLKKSLLLGHPYSGSCVKNAKTLLKNIFKDFQKLKSYKTLKM